MSLVNVIGGGLAGVELAYRLAINGIKVNLYEMRPNKMTEVHKTGKLAEIVCSNSFKSKELHNAKGLLKYEMSKLGSLILKVAKETEVPAGKSLNINREEFSKKITQIIENTSNITIIREEVKEIEADRITVIATGPLTSKALSHTIKEITGNDSLYFYDALSPIIDGEAINYDKAFWGLRYGKGEGKILNFPMNKEEYERFYNALIQAKVVPLKGVDEGIYFESCLPVEEIAKRGKDALRFGPLKPVGFKEYIKEKPYAIVQARPETNMYDSFELIGFQTRLLFPEQKKVFSLIPGLEHVKFLHYGMMHRNTYINSPQLLQKTLNLKVMSNIYFAGQISGVEGYVESAASGIIVALNILQLLKNKQIVLPNEKTMIGALLNYITNNNIKNFQPISSNFGLLPRAKGEKREEVIKRAIKNINDYVKALLNRGINIE